MQDGAGRLPRRLPEVTDEAGDVVLAFPFPSLMAPRTEPRPRINTAGGSDEFHRRAMLGIAALTIALSPRRPRRPAARRQGGARAFSFTPLDIGMRKGCSPSTGSSQIDRVYRHARMQRAMAADSLDIALGSGPPWPSSSRARRSGGGRDGESAAPLGDCCADGPGPPPISQGQEGQRLDRQLAHLLAGQRDVETGLGSGGIDTRLGGMRGRSPAKRGDIVG